MLFIRHLITFPTTLKLLPHLFTLTSLQHRHMVKVEYIHTLDKVGLRACMSSLRCPELQSHHLDKLGLR